MSQIAESLGVANAAVYWYFPSKDHLLAEVWERALDEELERLRQGPEDPFAQLIQGLIHLRPYRNLHMTIHERMQDSPEVTAVHERTLDWIRDTVRLGMDWRGREQDDLADLVVVLFEGANVPGMHTTTATDLISSVLDRFGLFDDEPLPSSNG